MPFNPPFQDRYKPGDLVYGLSEVREAYCYDYTHFRLSKTPDYISTIDQYPATITEREFHFEKTPDNLDDFLNILGQHPKYFSVSLGKGFYFEGRPVSTAPKDLRRKSKAGLYWGAKRSNAFSIHFLLDSLNFDQVIHKSHRDDRDESYDFEKYRAYTGSELRWVYRNRHDEGVKQVIQFWYAGKACCPPWEKEFDMLCNKLVSRLWTEYQP